MKIFHLVLLGLLLLHEATAQTIKLEDLVEMEYKGLKEFATYAKSKGFILKSTDGVYVDSTYTYRDKPEKQALQLNRGKGENNSIGYVTTSLAVYNRLINEAVKEIGFKLERKEERATG